MGNYPTRPKPSPLLERRLPFRSVLQTEGVELAKHDSYASRILSKTLGICRLINTFIEISQL